jgi:hypothetical protein
VELGCEKVVEGGSGKNFGSKRNLNQEVEAGSKSRKQKQGTSRKEKPEVKAVRKVEARVGR